MLLGGATPLQAAQVQLLVLIGLLLVQSITALLTTRLVNPLPDGLGRNVALTETGSP
jgi:putative ABC transport system permease protein